MLLSSAARESVVSDAPPSVDFCDLGEYRLKDLDRPEQLFQLVAPGLQQQFPPINAAGGRPTNLQEALTSFVGRDAEMEEVKRLLEGCRLLTLTGPSGTGKTGLAVQVALDLLHDFRSGTFFVSLAPISDHCLVASAIADALDLQERSGQPIVETVKEFLRHRHMLLLLDNFEQLLPHQRLDERPGCGTSQSTEPSSSSSSVPERSSRTLS